MIKVKLKDYYQLVYLLYLLNRKLAYRFLLQEMSNEKFISLDVT